MPRSDSRLMRSSTSAVCETPERRRRLVHDDELGVQHHGLGHRHRLPLAAGQRADQLADVAHRDDPQVLQRLLGRLLHGHLVQQQMPPHLVAEEHVLHDVQVVAERQILVDGRDPGRRWHLVGARKCTGRPCQIMLPRGGLPDPRDRLDQGGLARPVVPDQGRDLPGRDVEVDSAERRHRAEVLADAAQLQQRRVHGGSGCPGPAPDGARPAIRGPGSVLPGYSSLLVSRLVMRLHSLARDPGRRARRGVRAACRAGRPARTCPR